MVEILDEALKEQQKIERVKRVGSLFESGVDLENPGEIVAVHATSIEAIMELIEKGFLPTGVSVGNEGYIYFYRLDIPLDKSSSMLLEMSDQQNIEEGIDSYGQNLAFENNFCQMLGLNKLKDSSFISGIQLALEDILFRKVLSEKVEVASIRDLSENQLIELTQNLGVDDFVNIRSVYAPEISSYCQQLGFDNVLNAARKSFFRRGVMVGFNSAILKLNPESAYEFEDEGWRVAVPHGLSIDFISGIEPLGDYEHEKLEELQKRFQ